jgi:hypothetical protein
MSTEGNDQALTAVQHEHDDISARILIAIRDYAAMKLGPEIAHATFEVAVRDAAGGVTRATDPRAWVPLEVLHQVLSAYEDTLGPSFLTDVATWVIPTRRDLSSMSLTALTTADVFYAHIDRARGFFARHVRFESRREAPGRYAVELHYREGLPESRASCLVGKGVLHAVPLLFNLPPAVVTEHACRLDGANHCSYSVGYRHEPPLALYGAGLGTLIAALGALLLPSTTWLLAPLGAWLFGREIQHARTRAFMARVTEEQRRVIAENEADFQRRFDEMKSLHDALERRPRERNAQSPTNTS